MIERDVSTTCPHVLRQSGRQVTKFALSPSDPEPRCGQMLLAGPEPALLDQEQPALLQSRSMLAGEGACPIGLSGFARQDAVEPGGADGVDLFFQRPV